MAAPLPLSLRVLQLLHGLPDFPGRDTLDELLKPSVLRLDAELEGSFGGGLRYRGNVAKDDNVLSFALMRYSRPALAPVLDAALERGGVFADAGANLGIYTLWAARIVGAEGEVHSFEPSPLTFEGLRRNLELNGFSQVVINPRALGRTRETITLYHQSDASGLTSRYLESKERPFEVEQVTLDGYFAARRSPDLLKIDVEGMELELFRGMPDLLSGDDPPAVVWEANEGALRTAGTSYAEIAAWLSGQAGFETYGLSSRGVHPGGGGGAVPSSNVLSLRPQHARHARILDRLKGQRFDASQEF